MIPPLPTSPTSRTESAFENLGSPPRTPTKTAELWDHYEKLAREKAIERDETEQSSQTQIVSAVGNLGVTDAQEVHGTLSKEDIIIPSSASHKRASYCPLPPHLLDISTRISSAPSWSSQDATTSGLMCTRKTWLSDADEAFRRPQTTQQPCTLRPLLNSPPTTPTTPTWTSQSQCSTRRSSLAKVTVLPKPLYSLARDDSGTLFEFSTIYQSASAATSTPASLDRFGDLLQNQTSAWDDWDSDEEAEKARPLSWMGRRRNKSRAGKGSIDGFESSGEDMRKTRKSKDDKAERTKTEVSELARAERIHSQSKEKARWQKPSGFVRALSCGCSTE